MIKPKKTVKLKISPERIELHLNGEQNTVDLKDLKHLYLNYMDYGSWSTHSIYGNKNYIRITEISGKQYDFDILIRHRHAKYAFKRVLETPQFYGKFDFIKTKNSRTVS